LQRLREIAADAPDSPRNADELAWLLATYPDSNLRDGAEAVRLAERACALTDRRVPGLSPRWQRLTLKLEIFRVASLAGKKH